MIWPLLIFLVLFATSAGEAVNLPSLPQKWIDTSWTDPPGPANYTCTSATTCTGGLTLQQVLNAATCGQIIELTAGVTFTGFWTLGTNCQVGPPIVIRSTHWASLPPPGTRICPTGSLPQTLGQCVSNAVVADMPTVVAQGLGSPAIYTVNTAPPSAWVRLIGIELTFVNAPNDGGVPGTIQLGGAQTTLASTPHHITIDRSYIHAPSPSTEYVRGVMLNSAWTAIVESDIENFRSTGSDSQAIGALNAPGPIKIVNNFIEGASENILFGGGTISTPNLVTSDVEIRLNDFDKRCQWNPAESGCYGGTLYNVKNLFELKNAQRMLIEANTFNHIWGGGQAGEAIMFTPRVVSGWEVLRDITFRHNRLNHVTAGFGVSFHDTNFAVVGARILITNNVVQDLGAYPSQGGNLGMHFEFGTNGPDATMTHNTFMNNQVPLSGHGQIAQFDNPTDPVGPMTNFVLQDNIAAVGGSFVMVGGGGFCAVAFNLATASSGTFLNNALVGPWPTVPGITTAMCPANGGAAFFPQNYAAVGFSNLTACQTGDYHGCGLSLSSPFHNAATDGTDVGVNLTALDAAFALGDNFYSGRLLAPSGLVVH